MKKKYIIKKIENNIDRLVYFTNGDYSKWHYDIEISYLFESKKQAELKIKEIGVMCQIFTIYCP